VVFGGPIGVGALEWLEAILTRCNQRIMATDRSCHVAVRLTGSGMLARRARTPYHCHSACEQCLHAFGGMAEKGKFWVLL
jgi:hypothetical protein